MRNRSGKMGMAFAGLMFLALRGVTSLTAEGPRSMETACLYRTTFVRAAPGKLLELIALYKSHLAVMDAAGDERPLWWRHTQGDQWDLMLLFPMGNYTEYYSKARLARREKAASASALSPKEFAQKLNVCTSWREDVFVMGPPLEAVKKAFEGTAYYHLEIFIALPGKQDELFKEREMENMYAVGNGRPENMIFVKDQGAAWDLFTIGCYRDLQHWAESSSLPKEKRDAIARRAGFADADSIGPYMRTLIDMHRDTMGVAIK
ncbi:MAG: hypothetical protein ABR951_09425 [Candidatus Aminicenantales bacterium]